jgi:hypothetical protein
VGNVPHSAWIGRDPKVPDMKSQRLRDAFEHLDSRPQWILERILFAGKTYSQLARSRGIPTCEVRAQAISAMRSLRDASAVGHPALDGNDGLLALHALRALDGDEAAAVELVISSNPGFERRYQAERELVGALCSLWAVDPSEHVRRRLLRSIEATVCA